MSPHRKDSHFAGLGVGSGMLRLAQGQLWKTGDEYLRIVDLQRLEVKFKRVKDLETGVGTHHHVSKKEFCRLLKGAALVSGDKVQVEQAAGTEN